MRVLAFLVSILALSPAWARELVGLERVIESSPTIELISFTHSPDGRFVYAPSFRNDSIDGIWIFERNRATGDLASVELFESFPVEIDRGRSAAVSPDGRHVYVGTAGSGLALFERDVETGLLVYVERYQNGVGGVTSGLLDLRGLVVSSDGRHVYATSVADDALIAFARDPADGTLDFLETEVNGAGGVAGLDAPLNLVLAPDGRHLYAGSNGTGSSDETIAWFSRNATNGAIAFGGFVQSGAGGVPISSLQPMAIEISPDGRNLYTGFSFGGPAIGIFDRDPATGALSYSGFVDDGNPSQVLFQNPFALDASADGRRLYAASSAGWDVVVWERDPVTGLLTLGDSRNWAELATTQFLQLSPDGAHLYAGNLGFPTVQSFAIAPLRLEREIADDVDGADGLAGALFVAASPDDAHVYVSGTAEGEVGVFARDRETRALAPLAPVPIAAPRGIAFAPRGEAAYVVSGANTVESFARNAATGDLTAIDSDAAPLAWATPWAAAMSPGGEHLYVASRGAVGGGVAVFARNAATQSLAYVAAVADAARPEVAGARDVIVSRDGAHVYVAGTDASAVAAFARNAVTGALTFVEAWEDGVQGPNGITPTRLGGAAALAESPDGGFVYAAAGNDDAITIFTRNPASGGITPIGFVADGIGLTQGLDAPRDLVLSPDGRLLYAIALSGDAIVAFRRDVATGALGFAQVERDGVDGVALLGLPSGLAISRDGRSIYVATSDDALVAFAPEPDGAPALVAFAVVALAARRSRRIAWRSRRAGSACWSRSGTARTADADADHGGGRVRADLLRVSAEPTPRRVGPPAHLDGRGLRPAPLRVRTGRAFSGSPRARGGGTDS